MNHTDRVGESETKHDAIIQTLWSRRALIATSVGLCLALGVLYLFVATPKWMAYSTVEFQNPPSVTGSPGGAVTQLNYLNTQADVIQSRRVLNFALDQLEIDLGAPLDTLEGERNPVRALQRMLSVEPGKNRDNIVVALSSPFRDEAELIVDAVVKAYIEDQSRQRLSDANDLEQRLGQVNREVLDKRATLAKFQKENGSLRVGGEQSNVERQQFERLSDAYTQMHLERLRADSTYEEAFASIADNQRLKDMVKSIPPSGLALSAEELVRQNNELTVQRLRLQDARLQYMDGHPMVASLQNRVDQLTASYVATAREYASSTRRREAELSTSLEEAGIKAREIQNKIDDYTLRVAEMQSDIQMAQMHADQLHTRFLQARAAVDRGNSIVPHPQDPAAGSTTDNPTSPNKVRTLGIALLAGLFIGSGIALVSDWRDQRLRSGEDVQATLGVNMLGVVPQMSGGISQSQRGMKVYLDPSSDISEAYRTVRTAIYFGLPDDARTVLITSPSAGDGKSTMVSNLGISMAQAGRRVLIVDADFRLPTQHKIFDVDVDAGLSDVMSGNAELDDVIVQTSVENLHLLPCGALPSNPSELLNSRAFAEVLGDLASEYDYVLLDSPALMAVADARIASAWCDATVLVVHATRTSRRTARMAREGLAAVGANIVGVVVNDVSRNDNLHGFHARFGYGVVPAGKDRNEHSPDRPNPGARRNRPAQAHAVAETKLAAERRADDRATNASNAVTPKARAPIVLPPLPADEDDDEPHGLDVVAHSPIAPEPMAESPVTEAPVVEATPAIADEPADVAPVQPEMQNGYAIHVRGAEEREHPIDVEVPAVQADADPLAVRASDVADHQHLEFEDEHAETAAAEAESDFGIELEDEQAASTDAEAQADVQSPSAPAATVGDDVVADAGTGAVDGANDPHASTNGHVYTHEEIPGPRSPTDPAALAEQSRKLRDRMIALRHGRG